MNTNTFTRTSIDCTIRVLIVENNLDQRADHLQLVELWGYLPVAAVGTGTALLADARYKAQRFRCQVALVDMRLLDDYDPADISGLELAAQLAPTVSIIVSGIDDRRKAVQALKQYKAANFVGKQDNPEALHEAIEEAARAVCACRHNAEIIWPASVDSAQLMRMLVDDESAPMDEINELIGRLFPTVRHISLDMLTDPKALYERGADVHRSSLVCKLQHDDNPAFLVVKISRKDRVEREIANYRTYVDMRLPSLFVPVMYGSAVLWDVGAVAYGFMGNNNGDDPDGPYTFRVLYRNSNDIDKIMAPIEHFFDETNWGIWFKGEIQQTQNTLFVMYDEYLEKTLSTHLETWRKHEKSILFPDLGIELPNPTEWLSHHYGHSDAIYSRLAVTHGSLDGQNLFIDKDGHAWPIDFERTGLGPILRDFASLIIEIITISIEEMDLKLVTEFVVGIIVSLNRKYQLTPRNIVFNKKLYKSHVCIYRTQKIAADKISYDTKELLWNILIQIIYTTLQYQPKNKFIVDKNILIAGIICKSLEYNGYLDYYWSNFNEISFDFLEKRDVDSIKEKISSHRNRIRILKKELDIYKNHIELRKTMSKIEEIELELTKIEHIEEFDHQ